MSSMSSAATATVRGDGLCDELRDLQDPDTRKEPTGMNGSATSSAFQDWEQACFPIVGEAAFAVWQEELGHRVVEHRGRYWVEMKRGFFQPIHPLARLSRDEATRPSSRCWGYRARLTAEDEAYADATLPVHVLPDPQSYGLQRLSGRRRRYIKSFLRDFDVVVLDSPDLLLEQGYRLAEEAHAHNHEFALPEPRKFRRKIELYFVPGRGLAVAALRHDSLVAFDLIHAVDGVAYDHSGAVGREGLEHNVRYCMFYLVASIAQRSPGVRELMNGQHTPEVESLCAFKENQGCEVVQLPARAWFAPLVEPVLRRIKPRQHYRMVGPGRSNVADTTPAASG